MIFKILFGVYLLCVPYVAVSNSQCKENNYYNSTSCVPCPSNCARCESDSKCTQCASGFYGDLCKTACPQNCSWSGCHLKYGHCMYGCPDGLFPFKHGTWCFSCPENCRVCSSMSNCFTCRDGFYGQNCSAMCPSECADRACNQYGKCIHCKEGYYRQADICPKGCITCDNSTHSASCNETHVGSSHATCIRRCSENSTNFVSNFDQRCGISLDKISQNQSSCFAVNLKQSYKCSTWRRCISCHTEDCKTTQFESHTCLSYERCITECNTARLGIRPQTMCEQTCSIYHATNVKTEQLCSSITEDQITSSEDIACFQESNTAVNYSEDPSIPIAVFVLVLTVVISVLMTVTVVYMNRRWPYSDKYRCITKVVLTREVEEGLSTPRCMMSHDNATTTIYLTPTSERVYDKPN